MKDTYKHKGLRKKLVEELLKKGISDNKVLEAILHLPRHFYFDREFEDHAYEDKAFPIGEGQTISQPYTVAFQTELLEIIPGSKVLEIGTGSGYQASVLAFLGAHVYSVERKRSLIDRAMQVIRAVDLKVTVVYADGTLGLPQNAPFDRIIVTAGAPVVPETYLSQLKTGGILVIPVGDNETQKMLRVRKISETESATETFGDFKFVPLIGEKGW